LNRFQEAEPLLWDNYPIIYANRGSSHRRTREAVDRLFFLYQQWSKADSDRKQSEMVPAGTRD